MDIAKERAVTRRADDPAAWWMSWKADPRAKVLADRHYNRQNPDSPQFVPPGRALVLYAARPEGTAVWVTSWPLAKFTKHAWAGAWVNSLFRNEGAGLSSLLIRSAVAATRWHWPEVPDLGIVSFVDADEVRPKRDPGRCYRRAGFHHVGFTKDKGLYVFQLLPSEMPDPVAPEGASDQGDLFSRKASA